MNRIENALAALQEKKEKAFITYITAGLPNYGKTKELIHAQEKARTDIIELGIPFSDPVADGPVIQAASYDAILKGATLEKTFSCMQAGSTTDAASNRLCSHLNDFCLYSIFLQSTCNLLQCCISTALFLGPSVYQ